MQKVELYHDALEAKWDMEEHIRKGWKIHTCTLGCYNAGYSHGNDILVVYEK